MRLPWRKTQDTPDRAEPAGPVPVDVAIRDEMIRLGQFLKLANLVETGAEAKPVIAEGLVQVNGEVETRRGRQLRVGDVVELRGQAARVSDTDATDDLPW
ncbi:RNA-binding S4 domain-containing protein [Nocardioides oceani]|uniref:RNA-binding S4 domain-containing protein n=1 Tax=Nocardioides oceani TaxID=3058369 RepID=UPI003F6CC2E5